MLDLPAPECGVHDGDLAHVVVHLERPGSLHYVVLGLLGVARRFGIQAQVEVGVAELVPTCLPRTL